MKRRDFLTVASGVAGGGAAASTTAAGSAGSPRGAFALQDEDGESESESESDSGGGRETVLVGPNGEFVFEPEELAIEPGTTVEFVWESDNHNVVVQSGPDDGWDGYGDIEGEGFTYEHTFEVQGEYEYICEPHVSAGMEGVVIVTDDPESVGGGGGGGEEEFDVAHDIGVPIQKHFVGVAAFLAIFVTFVFTFYVLKYGESSHSSSPNRK